jgi:hypothetical protein
LHFFLPNQRPEKPDQWRSELLVADPVAAVNVTPAYMFIDDSV